MPRLRRRAWPTERGLWMARPVDISSVITARTPPSGSGRSSQKNGASALGLQRVLGLGSYRTAWTWLHKPTRDGAAWPGPGRRHGGRGRRRSLVGGLVGGRMSARHLRKKALVVIPAEVRGRAIGRIRMHWMADAFSRHPADVRAARGETWLGGALPTGSRATAASSMRAAIATSVECSLRREPSRPRRS